MDSVREVMIFKVAACDSKNFNINNSVEFGVA